MEPQEDVMNGTKKEAMKGPQELVYTVGECFAPGDALYLDNKTGQLKLRRSHKIYPAVFYAGSQCNIGDRVAIKAGTAVVILKETREDREKRIGLTICPCCAAVGMCSASIGRCNTCGYLYSSINLKKADTSRTELTESMDAAQRVLRLCIGGTLRGHGAYHKAVLLFWEMQ